MVSGMWHSTLQEASPEQPQGGGSLKGGLCCRGGGGLLVIYHTSGLQSGSDADQQATYIHTG
jgi:hypothetical protein